MDKEEPKKTVNKKKTARKIISVAMLLAWMIVIFAYSAKNAADSTSQSHILGRRLGSIVVSGWNELSDEQQEEFAARWDTVIRKSAHVTEFLILAVFLMNVFLSWSVKRSRAALLSAASGVFYAASDEFHQTFVPGRAGRLSDVGIDSCGIILGILIVLAACSLLKKTSENRS